MSHKLYRFVFINIVVGRGPVSLGLLVSSLQHNVINTVNVSKQGCERSI
jgi:hypothetical protein